jgi:hypothetical protein
MLEGKLENLELKAQNRALKEEAAQQANNAVQFVFINLRKMFCSINSFRL